MKTVLMMKKMISSGKTASSIYTCAVDTLASVMSQVKWTQPTDDKHEVIMSS